MLVIRLLALAMVFLLAGCGEKIIDPPAAGTVVQVPAFEWYVLSQAEMEELYLESGERLEYGSRLRGFAGRLRDDGTLVVVTPPPKHVDDDVVTTLGHEVLHLVLGEYHK